MRSPKVGDRGWLTCVQIQQPGGRGMSRVWSKPVIVEIAVGMEINCYACAELD
ncbi:MAG: pyrroloquinoline quinone precursor peptide PqqA [Alphaproteobacteria bacterium]